MNSDQYILPSSMINTKRNSNILIKQEDTQSSLLMSTQDFFNNNEKMRVQLDHKEYGIIHSPIIKFNPSQYGILENYSHVKDIYSVILSPTIVTLDTNNVTNKHVVRKTIFKDKLVSEIQKDFAYQECALHSLMKHENVVELYDYTENEKEVVMLMEYCNKPTYFEEKIEERLTPIKNEKKLQSYTNNILEGLNYVHESGVIHCDIKLQNAIATKNEDDYDLEFPSIKLCDFGLSHVKDNFSNSAHMKIKCGTHAYLAPEVNNDCFVTDKIDMWSFGILLYQMSVAYKPTQVSNYRYGSGPIPFRKFDWRKKSALLQDLIQKCLTLDPSERISSKDALEHPWLQAEVA